MTKKTKKRRLNPNELRNRIIQLFRRTPKKRYDANQLQSKLKIKNPKESIEDALDKLAKKEAIVQVPRSKFKLNNGRQKDNSVAETPVVEAKKEQDERPKKQENAKVSSAERETKSTRNTKNEKKSRTPRPPRKSRTPRPPRNQSDANIVIGKVDMTRHGAAYIICEDLENDIYVNPKKLNYALDGDTVEVRYHKREGKTRYDGEILNVVERSKEYFIGTLRLSKRFGFITPDKQNMFTDIFVPLHDINGAKDGEKVVVKVIKWQTAKVKSPIGKITESLGKAGTSDIEMKSILIQNGFELSFPDEVMEEANALSERISEAEIKKRRDFRKTLTFTIDPDTAKDFDDALSIEYFDDGSYEVGVHIADVSHYVKEDSALDKEAYKRSTSVYLVDRVLPMLPEKISNVLCSLRPNEDKLTFSAVFKFNKQDKLINEWFGKGIIHSDRRFTYEDAQEILEKGEGELAKELIHLNELSKKLRAKRFKEGSVDFGSPEVKFVLDDDGTPTSVYVKERKDSNLLIEDFMLLANRRSAAKIGKKENPVPFVYRIHDLPNLEKVADFVRFAQAMNYKITIHSTEQIAQVYTQMIQDAKERPELKILEPLAIRTMSKAVYSTDNVGHYGLGFEYYTHFTSPIRRYSDVLVHRIFEKNLKDTYRVKKDVLEMQCRHISAQERKATDAERQSVKYKQVEFMTNRIGETFTGVVSGMIDKGFFVELLDNYCEGMVDFNNMPEAFLLDESRLFAVGKATGNKIKMGDHIRVKIVNADLTKRNIDMEFVSQVG